MSDLDNLKPIFIKIAPEDLVLLKSILESYEDLGIIRTLNKEKGEIVILAVSDTVNELMGLLDSLKTDMTFRIIPPPDGICEDWLLTENKILFTSEE